MKFLLILLHLLPSFDQWVTHLGGYWIGLLSRLFSHFGVPIIWEGNVRKTWAIPFRIQDKRKTFIWSFSGLVVVPVVLTGLYFILSDQIHPDTLREEVRKLYPLTRSMYLAVGLVISLLNPLMEEFFWRGFLYRKYADKGGGIWVGAMFAIHHWFIFQQWFEPLPLAIATVGLAIVGILFNWLYKKTQNLYPCLCAHFSADITIVAIGYFLLFEAA